MTPKVARFFWFLCSLLVLAAIIGCWKIVTDLELVPAVFLPPPDRVWAALVRGFTRGDLLTQFLGTIERMLYGWVLASAVGVALGLAIGTSEVLRTYLEPMLEVLRPLPASAIIPFAIALLGLSEAMVLTVIAFGALWPMLLSTIHGVTSAKKRLYEVAKVLDMGQLAVLRKIAFPNALPDILAGMRVGLTAALILSIVGEMLASRPGMGQLILSAARSYQSANLFAGVALLGLIGYGGAIALNLIEKRLLRWQRVGT